MQGMIRSVGRPDERQRRGHPARPRGRAQRGAARRADRGGDGRVDGVGDAPGPAHPGGLVPRSAPGRGAARSQATAHPQADLRRGHDAVRDARVRRGEGAEVARRVGVSEKTIYNYFPTKESMVLDEVDEMVEGLAQALRERRPEESITDAVVRAIEAESGRFETDVDELTRMIPAFVAMIEQTPALHAAWLEVNVRLANVATEELARQAGVDPRDPEPLIAGRALVGLVDVGMQARVRHIQDGLRGQALHDKVLDDVRRAARLLDTGLWAFSLPASRRARTQAAEAARAAEEARRQVVAALREARAAWDEARTAAREVGEEIRRAGQDVRRRR